LDRSIEIPKKRIPWVKYFFQFTLPALLVSAKATAQGNVRAKLVSAQQSSPVCSNSNVVPRVVGPKSGNRTIVGDTVFFDEKPAIDTKSVLHPGEYISGIVLDEEDRPIPYASVIIKGTKNGMMADSMGTFRLEMPVSDGMMVLDITSAGFEGKELPIGLETDLTKEMVIRLDKKSLEGVTVVVYGSTRVRMVTGSVVMAQKNDLNVIKTQADIPSMIKVYPNPVVSGTNINVGCQKLKEGYYNLQLANQAGQQVLNKQAWIDSGMQVLNIEIPHIATGIYFLKLTNKETSKRFTQKIIVE
jgi:hypothetical protein